MFRAFGMFAVDIHILSAVCPVLRDSASTIAWLTHIETGTTAVLVVNRFDVRYHIIYVPSAKQCNCTATKATASHT